jgi:Paf1
MLTKRHLVKYEDHCTCLQRYRTKTFVSKSLTCVFLALSRSIFVMSERKAHKSAAKVQEKAPTSIWNKDGSDFICLPQFHNSLPNAPSGPYLKNIELSHRYQDFSQYKTSSLEKNYVWQPHFGPDLGLRLDLVDQEAILNPISIRNEDIIDASEMRLLKGDAPERGRGKLRSLEGGEKPWWLRNTTYLENNLYSSVVQTTNTDFKRKRAGAAFVSGIETFVSSFDKVEVNVRRLAKEAKEKFNTNVEWSIPVLPSMDLSNYFALARFDEDPDTRANKPKVESEDDSQPPENEAVHALLANIRQSNPDEEDTKTSMTAFFTSLVLPSNEKILPPESAAAATADGVEGDATAPADPEATQVSEPKALTESSYNPNSVPYKWLKNYSMDVNTKPDDSFILTIETPANGNASASASATMGHEGSVSYHLVRSKLTLKKVTDSDEHQAFVTRRILVE